MKSVGYLFIFLALAVPVCSVYAKTTNANITDQSAFVADADEQRLWNRSRECEEFLERSGMIYDNAKLQTYLQQIVDTLVPETVKS